MTPPERVLWKHLRDRRLAGLKFRRQHPIGPFIADFFCDAAKLVVEVDSEFHHGREPEDAARTRVLETQGVLVIRTSASQIARDLPAVLAWIRWHATARFDPRGTSPRDPPEP